MAPQRTGDNELPPPAEPGFRKEDRKYWCNCSARCHGVMTDRPRSTYKGHKSHRQADRDRAEAVASLAIHSAGASSLPITGIFDDCGVAGSREDDGELEPGVDNSGQGTAGQGDEDGMQRDPDLQQPGNGNEHLCGHDHRDGDEHQRFSAQYHPYWHGLNDESEPNEDSDDENDSDDESDSDGEDGDPEIIANLMDLKIALAYVQYIKDARIEDSGLDDSAIERLHNPPQCILDLADDPDLELCIGLYVDLGGASQKAYDRAMKRLQARFDLQAGISGLSLEDEDDMDPADRPRRMKFYSYDQVRAKIQQLTGVIEIKHDMCIKSCMAYTGPLSTLDECLKCEEARYRTVGGKQVPRQQFYTIPIGPQLQALARSPETARLLKYRTRKTDEVLRECTSKLPDGQVRIDVPVYEDYVHGSDYLKAVMDGDIRDQDFVLMMSIDGAQLYESKQSDCWIYIWVLMDLPPDQRYKKKYVMPGGFIPGPNKPKNIDSFLFPGIHHVSALQKEGLQVWNADTEHVYRSKPYLLFQTADGPGLCYCDGRTGHQGYIGCRHWCPIPGRRFSAKSDTYYPAMFKPNDWMPPGSDHPDINVAALLDTTSEARVKDYESQLKLVLESPDMDTYVENRRNTGISKPSLISGLSRSGRLSMLGAFPSDMMHLTALNITDILMKLFRGTLDVASGDSKNTWDWAVLMDDKVWKQHGQLVEDFKRYLSSSIDRPPRNPAKKINSGYKAKEFLSYVYGMLPALLYDVLPEPYYSNFCDLVWGVRILTQRSITREELQGAHSALIKFVTGFEEIYVQREGSRIHFIRQCIHNLIHLSPETVRTGPQNLLSQWVMERTIGNLGEEIKQPSNPYKNLSERGLRRAQVNAIIALLDLDPAPPPPRGSTQFGKGLYLMNPTGPVTKMKREEAEAFLEYAILQDPEFSIPSNGVTFAKKGRLCLPTEQIGRTAWKEKTKSTDAALRISRMVKIVEEYTEDGGTIKEIKIAEVEYFFEAWINDKKEGLAMVSLCEDPDPQILARSKHVLWVTRYTSGQHLSVVPIDSIKSVVSLLPFPKIPGTVFLFEDLGLDVSYLDSSSFVQGEDEDPDL